MGIRKIQTLEEVKGQSSLMQYGRTKINQGVFPTCTLWAGEEGIGKTNISALFSMAIHCESLYKPCYECPTCKAITKRVILDGKDNEYVKIFNMSIDGGKDAATQALAALNTAFSPNGKVVVILEECHKMDDDAQNVLLTPLENLPKGVYVMALTTDPLRLSKAFRSRFVLLNVKRPNRKEVIELLRTDAKRRNLAIQGGDATLDLIASWSDNKPRAALQVLNAMGEGCDVTIETVREFLDVIDVKSVIPLISSLNGSIVIGMNTIMDLQMGSSTQSQLIDILVEGVKLKENQMSYKLVSEDIKLLREAVQGIEMNRLVTFLYNVSALPELNKKGLIAAYLKGHPYVTNVTTYKPEMLDEELSIKAMNTANYEERPEKPMVSSMSELINRGTKVDK